MHYLLSREGTCPWGSCRPQAFREWDTWKFHVEQLQRPGGITGRGWMPRRGLGSRQLRSSTRRPCLLQREVKPCMHTPPPPSQKAVIASVRSYQAKHSEYFAGEYILLNWAENKNYMDMEGLYNARWGNMCFLKNKSQNSHCYMQYSGYKIFACIAVAGAWHVCITLKVCLIPL